MENEEILKHFDNIFGTDTAEHINLLDKTLLHNLYEYFEEKVFTPNERYVEIRHTRNVLLDKLRKTLAQEQVQLLDDQNELANEIHSIEYEQLFMFGYIIAKELDIECKSK